MTNDAAHEQGPADAPAPQLYLADIKTGGRVVLSAGGDHQIAFYGEMLVVGEVIQGGKLSIREWRRISLWTDSIDELKGIVALAGPIDQLDLEGGITGVVDPFDVRLYYSLLSEREPACEESDSAYPLLERLRGTLRWEPTDPTADAIPRVQLTLILDNLVEAYVGSIKAIVLDPPFEVTFRPLIDPTPAALRANTLHACLGGPPAAPAGPPNVIHDQRGLNVRFVSLSTAPGAAVNLEPLAQRLIDGACEVWWLKGGIKISPEAQIAAPANTLGGAVAYGQEGTPPTLVGAASGTAVEVYLVDHLTGDPAHPRSGGGITHNCGTFNAYIILEIGKAQHNRFLLAHELGHVLGMTHPIALPGDGCAGFPAGDPCSVMVPSSPNSPRNTEHNLNLAAFPLGPSFTALHDAAGNPLRCGWNADAPQGFFHYIRDFAADDGRESSIPELPATTWWTHSDVWNSNMPPFPASLVNPQDRYNDGTTAGALMFDLDNVPLSTEPTRLGPNYMFVRLHACQLLASPVNVYLYLALPGATTAALNLLTPTPGGGANPLVYAGMQFQPAPGRPTIRSVRWNVPSGYPPHSCVFAVADSLNEPTAAITQIVINPGGHTFFSLFNRLASDNDIAQRNLHIHETLPLRREGMRIGLPWMLFANPLEEAAPARVEIEVLGEDQLEGLVLEVGDQRTFDLGRGERSGAVVSEALQPGEELVLRFGALLPAGLAEGALFPIDVRLFVGDQLVSGYTYVLRVAPPTAAVPQMLDTLYGALQDVGVGCGVAEGLGAARSVARIARLHSGAPAKALEALGRLARRVAATAAGLDPAERPEYYAMRQRLLELAGLLMSWSDGSDVELFVEHIRDLADRIQESAGRLARARAGRDNNGQ